MERITMDRQHPGMLVTLPETVSRLPGSRGRARLFLASLKSFVDMHHAVTRTPSDLDLDSPPSSSASSSLVSSAVSLIAAHQIFPPEA
jgi:hypothetical protein